MDDGNSWSLIRARKKLTYFLRNNGSDAWWLVGIYSENMLLFSKHNIGITIPHRLWDIYQNLIQRWLTAKVDIRTAHTLTSQLSTLSMEGAIVCVLSPFPAALLTSFRSIIMFLPSSELMGKVLYQSAESTLWKSFQVTISLALSYRAYNSQGN